MQRTPIAALAVLALAALLPGLAGCSDSSSGTKPGDTDAESDAETEEEAPGVAELVAEGYRLLKAGQANEARAVFAEAAALAPDNIDARFGRAFGEAQTSLELLTMVLNVALTGGEIFKRGGDADYESQWDYLSAVIPEWLNGATGGFGRAVENYAPVLASQAPWGADFDELPIYFGLKKYAWMRGRIDRTDAHVFDGIARFGLSLTKWLTTADFEGDLGPVVSALQGGGLSGGVGGLLGQVADLLERSPTFLTIKADRRGQFEEVRALVGGALDNVVAAGRLAEAERQADDYDPDRQVFYFQPNANPARRALKANVWRAATSGVAGEERNTNPTIVFTNDLGPITRVRANVLRDGIAADAANPLPLGEDYLSVLGSGISLFVAYGLLDFIGLNLDLPLDPKLIVSVAGQFVPELNAFSIDLGRYLAAPKALRDLLPAWEKGRPQGQGRFYIEWECPGETADGAPDGSGGLFCKSNDGLVDAPHFVGTPYEIPADGITARAPYIAWQDPTFAGMLYIDVSKLQIPGEPGVKPATRATLNAALVKLLDRLVSADNAESEGEAAEGDGDAEVEADDE